MFLIRYFIFVLVASYLFWYITTHFFKQAIPLVKVFAYALIGSSMVGFLLWGLSVLVEGH